MITVAGIIGNEKNQYSLVRLIGEVNAEPESGPLHIVINSPGGDGELALDMHDYLRGLGRRIVTECKGQCASAATFLFLAGDKRIAGCPIMIHNPWTNGSGDSENFEEISKWMKEFEKRCEKFYAEKTGLDETTVSNMMKKETYIGPKESVSLKFATDAKETAMLLINSNKFKSKKMAKKTENNFQLFKKFCSLFSGEETVNMLELTATDGSIVVIDREEGEPQVGDEAAPDGSFAMPDGTTIVVTDGAITEIIPAEDNGAEVEALKNENAELKAQISALTATAKTSEEIAQLNAIKIAGGDAWLKKVCSSYKPAARAQNRQDQPLSKTAKRLAELREKKGLK